MKIEKPDSLFRQWLAGELRSIRLCVAGKRWQRYEELLYRAIGKGRKFIQKLGAYIGDRLLDRIARNIRDQGNFEDHVLLCLVEWGLVEDEDSGNCSACIGTGIGRSGDPDTSRCSSCGGSGNLRGRGPKYRSGG